jgi:hypothetical protein
MDDAPGYLLRAWYVAMLRTLSVRAIDHIILTNLLTCQTALDNGQ